MLPLLLAQVSDTAVDSGVDSSLGDLSTTASDIAAAQAATAAVAGSTVIWGGLMIVWALLALVGIFFLIWWIVLLMDLMKRDFPQKQTYLILMILSFFFGFLWLMDLIYYFGIVRKGIGSKTGAAPAKPTV